jgi:hypothetical protein
MPWEFLSVERIRLRLTKHNKMDALSLMTSVKQKKGSAWCVLACLESACRDKGLDKQKDVSQETLHRLLTQIKQGDDVKGSMFLTLAWASGFGNCVYSGKGKDYLLKCRPFVYDSVVLVTTNKTPNSQGYAGHCWRLKEIDKKGFVVMEPSDNIEEEFVHHPFEDLVNYDCDIWVITTVTDERLSTNE